MTALGVFGARYRRPARGSARGALGASPSTGSIIAYQIDMRTVGATTRIDGVFDAASCAALANLLSDISANPTSAAADEVVHDAEIRIVNSASMMQAACASPSTASAPARTGTTSSGSVPTQWAKDARVLAAQNFLNAELSRRGCSTTLKTDGYIGPGTCGALQWARPLAGLSPDLIALVRANAAPFGTACAKFPKLTAPSCPVAPSAPPPALVPTAPMASGQQLMVQLQGALNGGLTRYGYNRIPVTGGWDAATCGAGATLNQLLPNPDSLRTLIGSLTAQVVNALGKPCGVTISGAAPTKIAGAPQVTAPASRPASPAPPRADPCYIQFGTSNTVVLALQIELNKLLDKNGYFGIPVTGKWDADSCGAMYVLGGQFDPYIAQCAKGSWSVPASCPSKNLPRKKAGPSAPATPLASRQAGMVGLGLLAALGAVGVVIAKKKGLF